MSTHKSGDAKAPASMPEAGALSFCFDLLILFVDKSIPSGIPVDSSQIHRQASLRSLTTLQKCIINGIRWAADPGKPHSLAVGAPCGFQISACLFPAQRAAGYDSKPA